MKGESIYPLLENRERILRAILESSESTRILEPIWFDRIRDHAALVVETMTLRRQLHATKRTGASTERFNAIAEKILPFHIESSRRYMRKLRAHLEPSK